MRCSMVSMDIAAPAAPPAPGHPSGSTVGECVCPSSSLHPPLTEMRGLGLMKVGVVMALDQKGLLAGPGPAPAPPR